MSDGNAEPDDGGLGRALGDVSRQRREQEAVQQQLEAAETGRRALHARTIKHALERQDETTRKAVAAFLPKAARIVPSRGVPIGSVARRRFVPFTIETIHEPVTENAHLIYTCTVRRNEAYGFQQVAVRSNGVVMFLYNPIGGARAPVDAVLSRVVGCENWYVRTPSGEPGVLPFWLPEPRASPWDTRMWLSLRPSNDEAMDSLKEADVERTTEWFVRTLATYLDEHA